MKTMKMIAVLVALMLGSALQAKAQVVPFDYTGKFANDYNGSPLGPVYYPAPGTIPIGGPSNDWGPAEQFYINSVTNISDLVVNATIFPSAVSMTTPTAADPGFLRAPPSV